MSGPFEDPSALFQRLKTALDRRNQGAIDDISMETSGIPIPPDSEPAKRALWLWIQTIGVSSEPDMELEGLQEEFDSLDGAIGLTPEEKEYIKHWYANHVGQYLEQSTILPYLKQKGGKRRKNYRKTRKNRRKTNRSRSRQNL